MSSSLVTKNGKHKVNKVSDFQFQIPKDTSKGMNIPVTIFANDLLISKMIEDRTLDQAVNVTTLPGVKKHMVVLPDGHEGYGFPVGGVAASDLEEGIISPGGVGYDINCGVRLIRTNLVESDIRPKLKELVDQLFSSIPTGVGSEGSIKLTSSELDELLIEGADPINISSNARKRGSLQLGSLGSGNHFLEIQKVDKIYDAESSKTMGITKEGQIQILIHCGSRGFGHQVCSDYLRLSEQAAKKYNLHVVDRELACVPNNSPEGESYRKSMFSALNFAWANRQMITHWTRMTFQRVLKMSEQDLDMNLVYDVSHNIAKVERHKVEGEGFRDLVVHRKGATRAFPAGMEQIPQKYQSIGQPVIIPGSMGTASWILLGSRKSMDLSFGSTAHGAGRTMSRSHAKRFHTIDEVKRKLESKGIYTRSMTKNGLVEETPEAYKDVDMVADISHNVGIATKVVRLVPLGVIKG